LKHVANKNACQVIIATHSEVILDDAVDTNLTLLLNGEAVNLARQQDMKNALKTFGIEHYYNARVHPRILYIEGNTDIEMLRALAEKLNHPALEVLSGKLNCYYICNTESEDSLENRLDRAGGAYRKFEAHFHTLKKFVPDFQGIGIFDSDGSSKANKEYDGLVVTYWQQYELENYFITPELLCNYAAARFGEIGELFQQPLTEEFRSTVDQCLLSIVFSGDVKQLEEFHRASHGLRRTLLKSVKMSDFAEQVFGDFARLKKQPVLLNKGEFYKLVELINPEDIPGEVREKLDLLVRYLELPGA